MSTESSTSQRSQAGTSSATLDDPLSSSCIEEHSIISPGTGHTLNPDVAKEHFVETTSQNFESTTAIHCPKATVPVITLSAPDDEDNVVTSVVPRSPSQDVELCLQSLVRRGSDCDQSSSSNIQPTIVINQPLITEPEGSLENTEAKTVSSGVLKLSMPSGSELTVTRQRTMSHVGSTETRRRATLELPLLAARSSQETDNKNLEISNSQKKFAHTAFLARIWKRKGSTLGKEVAAEDGVEPAAAARTLVEVPRALRLEMLDDACLIVQKSYQMYKSRLGPKHRLSVLAEKRLEELKTQLGE